MARTTKTIPASSRTAKAGRTIRPGATVSARSAVGRKPGVEAAAKPTRRGAVAKAVAKLPGRVARSPAPASVPVQNKQELRQRIDKLERANVNLRIKNREATEKARAQADRIDLLEEELAQLRAATKPAVLAPKAEARTAQRAPRRRRETIERDPGDAVPPGVAPLEAAPMDDEAEKARRSLESHLSEEGAPN